MNDFEIKNELLSVTAELNLIKDKISKLKEHTHLKIKATNNEREKILIYNKFTSLLSKIKKELCLDVKYKKLKKKQKELQKKLKESDLNINIEKQKENNSIKKKIIELKEKYEFDILSIDVESINNIIIKKKEINEKEEEKEEINNLKSLISNLKFDINEN